jgi:hypothetical protein
MRLLVLKLLLLLVWRYTSWFFFLCGSISLRFGRESVLFVAFSSFEQTNFFVTSLFSLSRSVLLLWTAVEPWSENIVEADKNWALSLLRLYTTVRVARFSRAVCLSVTQIVRCLFLQIVFVCLCSCHCRHVVVVVLQPASRVLLRLENILRQMDFAKRFCLLCLPFVLTSVVRMKSHLDSKCNLLLSCLRCNRWTALSFPWGKSTLVHSDKS